MSHRTGLPKVFTSLRHLQTSAPLPPPFPSTFPPPPSPSTSRLSPLLPPTRPTPCNSLSALSFISSQSTPSTGRYLLARLHSRTYLLHPRDILTVPTLRLAPPGSVLSLTRILEVGSRDYVIRSPASEGRQRRKDLREGRGGKGIGGGEAGGGEAEESIPSWIAKCGLTVLEHTKSPLERIIKKKRRKGYKKTIEHKQGWTRLRVGDIELGSGVQEGKGLA